MNKIRLRFVTETKHAIDINEKNVYLINYSQTIIQKKITYTWIKRKKVCKVKSFISSRDRTFFFCWSTIKCFHEHKSCKYCLLTTHPASPMLLFVVLGGSKHCHGSFVDSELCKSGQKFQPSAKRIKKRNFVLSLY